LSEDIDIKKVIGIDITNNDEPYTPDWKLDEFSSKKMVINLNFENPMKVSSKQND